MPLRPASTADFANLADPKLRLSWMRDCVEAVRTPGHLHYPLLNLVSTFIDGLASAPPGKTKNGYVDYLTEHFPELCAAVGAEIFYAKYRCKAVHEFGLADGFAIGRESGLAGKYADTQSINGKDYLILNIDRLVQDFLAHIDKRIQAVR
jgi:hypothetical protein